MRESHKGGKNINNQTLSVGFGADCVGHRLKTHANTQPMCARLHSHIHMHTHRQTQLRALFATCVSSDRLTEAETHVYECAGFMYFHCFVCGIGKLTKL